jgi:homoserine acetyltransferase
MIENYLAHQGEQPAQSMLCQVALRFSAVSSKIDDRRLPGFARKWVNAYDPNSLLWISKAENSFTP